MPGFVLDSSVALSWLLPDEPSGDSKTWLDRLVVEGGIVPNLWPPEVENALLTAQRRQRITREQRLKAIPALADLPIETDPETSERAWRETLQLADDHGLTLYDAAYLELAVRLDLPLATFDEQLKAAAQRLGLVPVK
ncbi:type II toxin-antitoxin system VapC family toxin [Candidatus Methylocalor cossyra]|uniref:Ribonuclease VapC n=1 Tax=Candidatus Methylocalor cossyra TaxID=3108543 RepID=A0ABM9NMZ4_9GAMM